VAADCGSKLFGQWAAANCATLPTANAGNYTISICKPLLFWFPSKWWYINVRTLTFNLSKTLTTLPYLLTVSAYAV